MKLFPGCPGAMFFDDYLGQVYMLQPCFAIITAGLPRDNDRSPGEGIDLAQGKSVDCTAKHRDNMVT